MKCKDCGEDLYKASDGSLKSERRKAEGAAPEGRERRAPAPTSDLKPKGKQESPPKRDHFLHRKVFG